MQHPRRVLLVGVTDRPVVDSFRQAAHEAGFDSLEDTPSAEQARIALERGEPAAILVNVTYENAEVVCLRVRSQPRFSTVPIFGLTSELTDLSFPEIYGWGGDDILRLQSPRDLVLRLRMLATDRPLEPPKPRGLAVVADADRRRRIIVARVLHNAGFDVHFALDGDEAERACHNNEAKLMVADAALGPDGAAATVQRLRAAGITLPCVITAEPKRIPAVRRDLTSLARVAVTDAFAPPENVLFCANELAREGLGDLRASPRLLYGTVVAFRVAGRDEDAYGFTYNMSAGGIYVRTVAPPRSGDDVWLELRPPRCDRRVRLEAKVAWSRRFGPIESATVPPGFGVKIADATKGDMTRFLAGYEAFRADVAGVSTPSPSPA